MKRIYILLVASALMLIAPLIWLLFTASSSHMPEQTVEVMIPKGASTIRIGRMLEHDGVISSSVAFRFAARLKGVSATLKSGLYRFEKPASINDILDRLSRGDVMQFQITVPEGLRNDEILSLLSEKSGVEHKIWHAALHSLLPEGEEGRLLPETYQYTKPIDVKKLLTTMLKAQQMLLDELTTDRAEQQRLRIAASIIEKETRLDHERPLVSAVIRNRLHIGMPLQMDPTVIYGIWKTTGNFSGDIRKRDLSTDTPWNSYTRRGLPPTPIGNPGAASIRAAANPADVNYLYFVADGSGGHQFAATHEQHLNNVEAWIRIERQKRGK